MVEKRSRAPDEEISAFDAANYCYAMATEMALVARSGGMEPLALALDHVKAMASLSMRQSRPSQPPENPAPEDAA
jgi:hypothetical protein